MKRINFVLAATLLALPVAASVPTPPPQICVDDNCSSTKQSVGFEFPDISTSPSSAPLRAVSTFENVSLYWNEPSGAESNEALVRFRKAGAKNWRQGMSLWFDKRAANRVPYGSEEYRGSLVELESNSTYEVEVLALGTGKLASTRISTWNEAFPIAAVVELPSKSNSTLNITRSGTATGYILYTAAPGQSATIDGARNIDMGVNISGSYVIVRGLTVKNTRVYGISIGRTAHHVVIEKNDISGFGRQDPTDGQFGCNNTGGIGTATGDNFSIKQVVIQDNKIHHPAFDANSWEEKRQYSPQCNTDKDLWHAAGSTGIYLYNTGGNHVIRHNEIYSDLEHMFDDGIGGGQNFSTNGNVRSDSDIYGNKVSHTWDDAIESEGANQNVRIYRNYVEHAMIAIAAAPVAIGPLYVFRNVSTKGIRGPGLLAGEGWFYKTRNKSVDGTIANINLGGGRAYLLHNTIYRTTTSDSVKNPLNVDEISVINIVSRNNILQSRNGINGTYVPTSFSDFDYDMYPASQTSWNAEQIHGIKSDPTYDSSSDSGRFALKAGAPGQDVGIYIPNFNDDFAEDGPDVGAQERGKSPLMFGVR